MKAETKYVAFNGVMFDTPDAAKHYETTMYLKTRHRNCIRTVNMISKSVRDKRSRIEYLIEQLTACNTILRNQSSNDTDIFNAKTRRFNMRAELELLIPEYVHEKNILRKYNKKLSYYYNRIMEETKNQIKNNENNTNH